MKKLKFAQSHFYSVVATFILALFFYISYKTPLAGDDWGYALNGMKSNPFLMAIEYYFSWSGRFFSELYGFLVTPHKWLWNILNPLLFFSIYICIYKLAHVKKRYISTSLLILAAILSVDDHVRMETYSWLMGTTYVIPLLLSLIYFLIIEKFLFKRTKLAKKDKVLALVSNIFLFYIGLSMENIAAMMVLGTIIICIYSYFNKRETFIYFLINAIVMTVSFLIMRLSPGSTYRLLSSSYDWYILALSEKLVLGYHSFIEYTFLNNNYLIALFSMVMILRTLDSEINKYLKALIIIIQLISIITVFNFILPIDISFLYDSSSLFNSLFWLIDILVVLYILLKTLKGKRRLCSIFFFIIGGSANIVMIMSPIFAARSSIYTIFYLILVMGMVLDDIKVNRKVALVILAIFIFIIIDRSIEYLSKYRSVGLVNSERENIIEYYKENPDLEEVYIPRFPVYSIHGADIESDDLYHLELFKEYYGLSQDATKIIFYFMEVN